MKLYLVYVSLPIHEYAEETEYCEEVVGIFSTRELAEEHLESHMTKIKQNLYQFWGSSIYEYHLEFYKPNIKEFMLDEFIEGGCVL